MIDLERLRKLYKFGKEISLKDAQILLKAAKSESIKKKEIIFEEGSKDTTLYFLRKGLVRMYHIKDNGDEITFNLIPEYNIVANFEFIVMQSSSKFYYETLEDCSFFSIDYNEVEKIISNNPKLESNRKFFLRRIVKNSAERVQSFVLMNPEERYIKFVKDNPNFTNRVPDKYIAHVIGITPVSLSRIRKRIALKK